MFKFLSFFSLFLVIACGESPLFNHSLEARNVISSTMFSESETLLFTKSDYSFIISWQEGPQLGTSKFLIKTWRNDIGSINGPYQNLPKSLNVFLWMPAMGHGSAPVKIAKVNVGEYQISEVQFIMGGKWEIKFQIKDGSQVVDEVTVPVSL